nr:thioesterase family protein [Sphingobium sp. JAI105]
MLQWSECDPAGIIFFPHYAGWMVEGVNMMFLAFGVDPTATTETGQRGLPSTGYSMNFHSPAILHDTLIHEIKVSKIGTKSVSFEHRFLRDEVCLADAAETRIWIEKTAAGMRSQPIPDEVRAELESEAPLRHPLDRIERPVS